jgi:TsgA-like MFS transporter
MRSKVAPTVLAIAAYAVVAAVFTESGVILRPAASYFNASLPDTAALISYASGGNFAGVVASIAIFSVFPVRPALLCAYAMVSAGVVAIFLAHDLRIACLAMAPIGFGTGVGLSGGAVIIGRLYDGRARALAFIGTDVAFSATGFLVPAIAGATLAVHWPWQTAYVPVGLLAAGMLIASFAVRFPETRQVTIVPHVPEAIRGRVCGAIGLFGLAITAYVTGETTFTLWAPTVLATVSNQAALEGGAIVSLFYGSSLVGLITAAILVQTFPPRAVLMSSVVAGAALTIVLALLRDVRAFFIVSALLGFSTTCMFKLMISIGSEQLPEAPPLLVTILVLCGGIGIVCAPVLSAAVVAAAGTRSTLAMIAACYATTMLAVVLALSVEHTRRRRHATQNR